MRRFMMRIAERVAVEYGCGALITGESLGQGCQPDHARHGRYRCGVRPAGVPSRIGMDKEEIVTIARKIDTFETSILPYEDCCTVLPRSTRIPSRRCRRSSRQRATSTLKHS